MAHDALRCPGKETVAPQVVQTIHVQLRGDQTVQVPLRIVAPEDPHRRIQGRVLPLVTQQFHHRQGNLLVGYPSGQFLFQRMGKRRMPHIVQQDGDLGCGSFLRGYLKAFLAQGGNGAPH